MKEAERGGGRRTGEGLIVLLGNISLASAFDVDLLHASFVEIRLTFFQFHVVCLQ